MFILSKKTIVTTGILAYKANIISWRDMIEKCPERPQQGLSERNAENTHVRYASTGSIQEKLKALPI